MSKKVMVLSKALEGKDLDRIKFDEACRAYSVPASLVDLATVMLPDVLGLAELSLDVPKFDKKSNSLAIVMHKKNDGEESLILKLKVSFDDKTPHEFKLSTDGGETWKEITYKGSEEAAAPVEA